MKKRRNETSTFSTVPVGLSSSLIFQHLCRKCRSGHMLLCVKGLEMPSSQRGGEDYIYKHSSPKYVFPPIQQSSPWYISNRSAAYVCSLKTRTKPLTVALFVTPPNGKLPTCPSTVDWISKLCYIHIMEAYSTMRNEQPRTTCHNTVLSQENQTQNDTGCGIPFIKCIKTRKKSNLCC